MASADQGEANLLIKTPTVSLQKSAGAVMPTKENILDVGSNLTLIARTDNRAEDLYAEINGFETGLTITSHGRLFGFAIYSTQELVERGYELSPNPTIVVPGEPMKVYLKKFREKAEDLELPYANGLLLVSFAKVHSDFSHPVSRRGGRVTKKMVPKQRIAKPLEVDEEEDYEPEPPRRPPASRKGKGQW